MSDDSWLVEKLPTQWASPRLGDLCDVVRGGSPRPMGDPRFFGGSIPFVKISDVTASDGRTLRETSATVTEEGSQRSRLLRAGSLILSNSATICVPVFLGVDACIHDGFVAFDQLSKGVLQEYLFHFFNYVRPHLRNKHKQGVTQVNLNTTIVGGITIPLPPLAEQKRIVAKIEELFSELEAGEGSLREARRQLGVYRQSLLKQAFGGQLTAKWRIKNPDKLESPEALLARIRSARQSRYELQLKDWAASRSGSKPKNPAPLESYPPKELVGDVRLPADWIVLAYGDLCSVIRNGISEKPTGDTGHKIARISAVRPMVFDYEDYRFIDCDDETAADYALVSGDLIFTRYNGARRFVGVCAQFKGQEARLYPDKLIRTRPDLPQLDPRYLEIALNCGLSRAWLETKIRTTAGQSGVSGGDVKAMPVPLCSLPEQQQIVRVLDEQFEAIEQNEREIDRALRQSAALRQSILKKAFTGKLVPQDPADEPASALLSRLRAAHSSSTAAHRGGRPTQVA